MRKKFFNLLLAILSFHVSNAFGLSLYNNEDFSDFAYQKTTRQLASADASTTFFYKGEQYFLFASSLAENIRNLEHTKNALCNHYEQIAKGDPIVLKKAENPGIILIPLAAEEVVKNPKIVITTQEQYTSNAYRLSKLEIANFFHQFGVLLAKDGFIFNSSDMFRMETCNSLIKHIDHSIQMKNFEYLKNIKAGLQNFYQQINLGDPIAIKKANNPSAALTQQDMSLHFAYKLAKGKIDNFFRKFEPIFTHAGFKFDNNNIFISEALIKPIDYLLQSTEKCLIDTSLQATNSGL